ncbi:MAG: hypothetical protein JWM56_1371 [Candidatus Peribacteria bacterium]|nr:hypothetical protein [Candidatus Peribacteria bacterium]
MMIPFLQSIPDNFYYQLDPREFLLPDAIVSAAREELEELLGHYVMTYNKDVFLEDVPAEKHLCAHLAGALLTDEQKKILEKYETAYTSHGVSFVVYEKPLRIIPVESSTIHEWIQMKKNQSR